MDALPIDEQTGAEYASQTSGVMHACGHDGHTAIGLTVARLLHAHRDQWSGIAKLVFQPAEEGLGGAKRMVDQGVLANPTPQTSLALHVWNDKPLGWLGIAPGPVMAAAEVFRVRISGKGGHGAAPHLAVDPLLAAAQVISALQSIVSRNVSPMKTAVVSVTALRAGEAFNVIPHEATFQGTVRTFDTEVRQQVIERFHQIVNGVSEAMGSTAEIELRGVTPAVVNNPETTRRVAAAAAQVLPGMEISSDASTMGSEDMALMMQEIPGCYVFVGSANPEQGLNAPHHHPRFDFDERALPRAAALMAAAAVEFMPAGSFH
jgi:amidohydrolase